MTAVLAACRGVSRSRICRPMGPIASDVVAVSTGASDAASPFLARDLDQIRRTVGPRQVIWLIPRDRRAACLRAGHVGIDPMRHASADGVPPRGYSSVSREGFRARTYG